MLNFLAHVYTFRVKIIRGKKLDFYTAAISPERCCCCFALLLLIPSRFRRSPVMAATKNPSSFSRILTPTPSGNTSSSPPPGVKLGPNGTFLVSSGIPTLDKILGGGIGMGCLVMVLEDNEAPHHLLLLRSFMSQGLLHNQPLLFASPEKNPHAFLGTLPGPLSSRSQSSSSSSSYDEEGKPKEVEEKNLRIAWQYSKYFEEERFKLNEKGSRKEFADDLDVRKPLDRRYINGQVIECLCLQDIAEFDDVRDRCSAFLARFSRSEAPMTSAARIAIQSLCAPQCGFSDLSWSMLSFIKSLRAMLRSSNAVAVITLPSSLISLPYLMRQQHMADILLSVKALPDEDKELSKLLTDYNEMVGLIRVSKTGWWNSQVPNVLESSTFSLKLHRRRCLILERLNQAPVDASGGDSNSLSVNCSASSGSGSSSMLNF